MFGVVVDTLDLSVVVVDETSVDTLEVTEVDVLLDSAVVVNFAGVVVDFADLVVDFADVVVEAAVVVVVGLSVVLSLFSAVLISSSSSYWIKETNSLVKSLVYVKFWFPHYITVYCLILSPQY